MRNTGLGTSKVRLMHGGPRHPRRLSAAHVAQGLLSLVAFAIAAGYLAGVAVRVSPPPQRPAAPTAARYTADTPPAQTAQPPATSSMPGAAAPSAAHQAEAGASTTGVPDPRIVQGQGHAPAPPMPQPVPAPVTAPAGKSPAAAPVVNAATDSTGAAQRFHVEIGTHESAIEAEAVAKELRRRGYAVHVGQTAPYGVRVGGYLDRPTAERLVGLLAAAGFEAALIAR